MKGCCEYEYLRGQMQRVQVKSFGKLNELIKTQSLHIKSKMAKWNEQTNEGAKKKQTNQKND